MFALIPLDGYFDLPQDRLAALADRHAQGGDGALGVEIKDAEKILVLEVVFRFQAAAGHQGIGDADGGGVPKGRAHVKGIILLQETAVNYGENVLLVVIPVF